MGDLLVMGGEDIYTASEDDFAGANIKISIKECEKFDQHSHHKAGAFRWAGCYSEGWE